MLQEEIKSQPKRKQNGSGMLVSGDDNWSDFAGQDLGAGLTEIELNSQFLTFSRSLLKCSQEAWFVKVESLTGQCSW